jgi:hypothetical protein
VDTLGLVWSRWVSSANTSDQAGFMVSYATILLFVFTVLKVFADQGYRGDLGAWLGKKGVFPGWATLVV